MALPAVILALFAATALSTAAVVSSINAQQGTVRDQNSKQALAAAEAGIANAMLRYNRVATSSSANACLPVGGTATGTGGWCANGVGPVAIDEGSYSYRVQYVPTSGTTPAYLQVVSTGTVDGASRRVSIKADTVSDNYRPFSGDYSIIGLDSVHLNSNATISAGVATNGNLGTDANSAIVCDSAQVGIGKGQSPAAGTIGCPLTQGTISLPPVNPGDVATNNSNSRICGLDPCVRQTWVSATKRLSLAAGGSVTLGTSGGTFNYAFCKLSLASNSYLYVASGAVVRIYFLSPEECAGETQPLSVHSNSKIQPTGTGATDLSLLFVGSPTIPTTVDFASNTSLFCSQAFVIYGPATNVELSSNNNICGGVAAKSILLKSNVAINSTNAAGDWELPGADQVVSHFTEPRDFIECTVEVVGTSPDGGC